MFFEGIVGNIVEFLPIADWLPETPIPNEANPMDCGKLYILL
jgi:hypothetical protein